MTNRQNSTLKTGEFIDYFSNPKTPRHRQYEAIRAIVLEGESVENAARQFAYKPSTLHSLLRDARAGKVELFPAVQKGPTQKRTPPDVVKAIIALRKEQLSSPDIQDRLNKEGVTISARTVERVLKDAGYGKLKRRTNKHRFSWF